MPKKKIHLVNPLTQALKPLIHQVKVDHDLVAEQFKNIGGTPSTVVAFILYRVASNFLFQACHAEGVPREELKHLKSRMSDVLTRAKGEIIDINSHNLNMVVELNKKELLKKEQDKDDEEILFT